MHYVKRFLIKDLEINGIQLSIDPEADVRFAKAVGVQLSLPFMPSQATTAQKITKRRLRVLNGLVKLKIVKASWTGAPVKEIGVNRIRVYTLSSDKLNNEERTEDNA